MNQWARLESNLTPEPLFPVQEPDGLRNWAEADRQATFRGRLRMIAPSLIVWANANAGRRRASQAIKEGIVAGVFDLTVTAGPQFICFPEMKGYDSRGKAGRLSREQVDWGNKMHLAGHHVASFFCPDAAVAWVRSLYPAAFIDRVGL